MAISVFFFALNPYLSRAAFTEKFNYQGKLYSSGGGTVPDGNYDLVFRLYADPLTTTPVWTSTSSFGILFTDSGTTVSVGSATCGGAGNDLITYTSNTNEATLQAGQTLWNVSRKESAIVKSNNTGTNQLCIYHPYTNWGNGETVTNRVYVKNGLFSTMLGDFNSLSGVDFNQPLYLGVTVGSDSEMKPRRAIGTVPSALNTKSLNGLTWDNPGTIGSTTRGAAFFSQLAIGTSTYSGSMLTLQGTSTNALLNIMASTSASALYVSNNGNVGIGTNNPGSKLDVNGRIFGSSLALNTTAASVPLEINGSGRFTNSGNGANIGATVIDQSGGSGASRFIQYDSAGSFKNLFDAGGNSYLLGGSFGIGTTTPQATLHVKDSGSAYIVKLENSQGYGVLGIDNLGLYMQPITANKGVWFYPSSGANGMLGIASSGNVGIGTTTPDAKLVVNGNRPIKIDTTNGVTSITGQSSSWATGYTFNSSDGTTLGGLYAYGGTSALNYFNIGPAYNSSWLTLNNGKVGVGTTSPLQEFAVLGNSHVQGNSTTTGILYASSLVLNTDLSVVNGGTGASSLTGFIIGNGTNAFTSVASSSAGLASIVNDETGSGPLVFATAPILTTLTVSSGGAAITGNSSVTGTFSVSATSSLAGILYVNSATGHVGIGTTTPSQALQVYDNNSGILVTGYAADGASSNASILNGQITFGLNSNYQGRISYNGAGTGDEFMYFTNTYNNSARGFKFTTGFSSNPVMTILGNGNVGIGTTSPGAALSISRPVSAYNSMLRLEDTGTQSDTSAGIDWRNTQYNWDQGRIAVIRDGSASDFHMAFSTALTGVNYERMRITDTGYVGIGTSTPGSRLVVGSGGGTEILTVDGGSAAGNQAILYLSRSSSIKGQVGVSGNPNQIINGSVANDMAFRSTQKLLFSADDGATAQMAISNNGYVGIGTSAPAYYLHLGGDGRALKISDTGAAQILMGNNNGSKIEHTANQLAFTTSQTQGFTFNGANVGIGSSSPIAKLSVVGDTYMNGNLRVTGTSTFDGKTFFNQPMVEGDANYRVYHNLASFGSDVSAATGTFAILTNIIAGQATMATVDVDGYFYDATSPFKITIGFYRNSANFYQYGYINTGANKLPVFLATTTGDKVVILLGTTTATYSYPKISVTQFTQGYSAKNIISQAENWSISQVTTTTAYSALTAVTDKTTLAGTILGATIGSSYLGSGAILTTLGALTIGDGGDTITMNASNWDVTNTGAATFVGVNSGAGLIQGTGGLTITGNTSLAAASTTALTVSGNTILNTLTTTGAAALSSLTLTTDLAATHGGTGTSTAGTAGSVIYSNGTSHVYTAVGANGQILRSNAAGMPTWVSTTSLGIDLSTIAGTLAVGKGGTGATTLTGVIKGNGASAMTAMTGTTNYLTKWTDANTIGNSTIYDNGSKVGIGISNPSGVLDLGGSTGGRAISWGGTGSNYANIWTAQSSGALMLGSGMRGSTTADTFESSTGGNYGRAALRMNMDGSVRFYTQSASIVADGLYISPTERMTINSSGYVGIGTTSPIQEFTVLGDTHTQGNSSVTGTFSASATSSLAGILFVNSATGNVGVGTNVPVGMLDISGTLNPPAVSGTVNKGMLRVGNYQHVGWAGSELNVGVINDAALSYASWIQSQNPADYSVSRPLLLNPNGGNIGIGTTSPSQMLTVGANNNFTVSSAGAIIANSLTLTNDLSVAFGGTGASSLTGFVIGNGTNAFTSVASSSAGLASIISDETGSGGVLVFANNPTLNGLTVNGLVTSYDDYYTSVTFADGWLANDYRNVVTVSPDSAQASGHYRVSIDATRNSVAEASTYEFAIDHANSEIWREAGVVNDNSYTGGTRCFTVDVNGSSTMPRIRVRALKAGAACGTAGTSIAVNVKVHSIGRNLGWSAYAGSGSGGTVSGYQSMSGMSWNLYTGNSYTGAGNLAVSANYLGNVGIGTTSPSQKLDVAGRVIVDNNYGYTQRSSTGITVTTLNLTGGDNLVVGQATTQNDMYFNVGGMANALVIKSTTGNVGIGTTTPSQKLEISGTTNPALKLTSSNDLAYNVLLQANWDANHQMGLTVMGSEILGRYAGNTALMTGNVGVGTTNPQAKLDLFQSAAINTSVPGLARYGLHLTPQNATVDTAVGITFGAGDYGAGQNAQAGIYSQFSGAYGTKLYFGTTNSYANGVYTRMTIDSAGNVGIGTTAPISKLHVAGSGSEMLSLTSMGGIHLANGYNDGTWGVRLTGLDNGSNGHNFNVQTRTTNNGAFQNSLTVTSSGNIGIGTTTPIYKLDVNTPIVGDSYSGLHLHSDAYGYVIEGGIKQGSGGALKFTSNNGGVFQERVRFDVNGFVGIGTSTPGYRLDVNNGSATTYPISLTSANTVLQMGALNGTYAHFNTTAASGFYFYQGLTTAGQFSGSGAGLTGTASSLTAGGFSGSLSGDVSGTQGATVVADDSHAHTVIGSKPNYSWSSSTLPAATADGVTASFVRSNEGWQSYGTVLNVRSYVAGGGTLQLYTPYSPGNGGTALQYRSGDYEASNNWTGWKTLIDSGNIGSQTVATANAVSFNGGLTTISSPTFAGLTLTNDLTVANGGTGASTLTGFVIGNGTNALTSVASSSAGLASIVNDETGSGALVFNSGPTVSSLTVSSGGATITGNSSVTGTFSVSATSSLAGVLYVNQAKGNIGVGTSDPQVGMKMDVRSDAGDGNSAITAYGYNGNGGVAIKGYGYATAGTGNNYGLYGLASGARAGGANIGGYFEASGAAANYALITGSGNVGIGATSPVEKLDVRGNIFVGNTDYINNTTGSFLRFKLGAASGNTYSAIDSFVDGGYTGGKLVLNSAGAGNVGIGTNNPTLARLQVNGSIAIDSTNGLYGYNGTGIHLYSLTPQGPGDLSISGYAGVGITGGKTGGPETSSYGLFVTSANNVGIGTTTPSAKLDVRAGAISGSENIATFGVSGIDSSLTQGDYLSILNGTSTNGLYEPAIKGGTSGTGAGLTLWSNKYWSDASNETIMKFTSSYQNGLVGFANLFQWGEGNPGAFTPQMTMNYAGYLGVGTTVPQARLNVATNESSLYAGILQNQNSNGNGLKINAGGNTAASFPLNANRYDGTNLMYVRGDGYGYLLASAWAYGSDRRLKENISYLNNGLSVIEQLKPAKFDYINGQKEQLGFIAQDVAMVIPEAVTVSDPETGMLSLKSDFIIPYLVNAIKEQQAEIDNISNQVGINSTTSKIEIINPATSSKTAILVRQENVDKDIASFQNANIEVMKVLSNGEVKVVGSLSVDGRTLTCAGACPAALADKVDETRGDMGAEGKMVAGAFEKYCEEGYVWVNGSAKYGTMPGFCVMETLAAQAGDGLPMAGTSSAWTSISQGDAQMACQSLGGNAHLISENEWLTLAEQIIKNQKNDLDSATTGLQLGATTTHYLASNQAINGLVGAGNSEWTDMSIAKGGLPLVTIGADINSWLDYDSVEDYKGLNIMPPYYLNSTNNIGQILLGGGADNIRGFIRGYYGVFSLDVSNPPTATKADVGFRCAK